MREIPFKIGLVLDGPARDPLAKALSDADYDVHIASTPARVQALIGRDEIDAWVFDVHANDVFDLLRATGSFLLPADDVPGPDDRLLLANWTAGLLRHLDAALTDPVDFDSGNNPALWSKVESVWLLAGSAGATAAVQAFFNAFTQPPPIAFIYAQHYDPAKQHQLESLTLQNNQFSLVIGEGLHTLVPGRIVMIPPRCRVTLGKFGQVSSTRADWGSHYTPDINELLVIFTAANLPSPGVIVFSGMGDDGAASLRVFDAAGGRIWVQTPDSAVCQAMPQAALDTGLVHRSGEPAELARALEGIYPSRD